MSADETTVNPGEAALAAAAESAARAAAFTGERSPAAIGQAFAEALGRGTGAPAAALSSGLAPEAAACLEQAPDVSAPDLLAAASEALGTLRLRRAEVRGLALYPLVLGVAVTVLGWVLATSLAPALASVNLPLADAPGSHPPPTGFAFTVLALGAAMLFASAAAFAIELPFGPFQSARTLRERAAILGTAASAARLGASLPAAFRAGAALVPDGEVRWAALALAGSLERGEAPGPGLVFDALGAALFASASAHGNGAGSLDALAAVAEENARLELPAHAFRIEAFSVAVGAVSVLAAAVAFAGMYAHAFGGG